MASRRQPSFRRMVRARPVRTAVFTLGPLVFGAAQILNASVHGSGVFAFAAITAAISAVMVAFSVVATRYHLCVFRRRTITEGSSRG